jgi:hypothetical protein
MPWLGIGVHGEWDNFEDALHASDLFFDVVPRDAKVEIYDPLGTGFGESIVYYENVPGVQVNIQFDNNRILGCVSNQYGIIQNYDAFSLLQPFTDAGAIIKHAGMTEQGLCFMIAEWNNFTITGDEYKLYIMCTNSFNGSYPCGLILTPVRIFCQNMYRKLLKDNLINVRHMSLAQERITSAKVNTDKIVSYVSDFSEILGHANDIVLNAKNQKKLVALAFPYPKDKEAERYQSSVERIDRIREEFNDTYMQASDIRKYAGTAAQFIHAWFDYLSHGDQQRKTAGSWEHKRFSRLVSGEVNMVPVKEALKL